MDLRKIFRIAVSIVISFVLVFGSASAASAANINPYYVDSTKTSGTSTSPTFPKPTNAIPGTLLIAATYGASNTTLTPPTGWTMLGTRQTASGGSWVEFYYYMLVDGDEAVASWTGTLGASIAWYTIVYAAAGVDLSSPIDASVTGSTAAAANPTLSAITTTTDNALVVAVAVAMTTTPSFTPPTGMTERYDNAQGNTFADVIKTTAGSTGTKQFTSASDDYSWALIALKKNTNASRLYFTFSATPAVTPAFGTGWELTSTSIRRRMDATKVSLALTTANQPTTSATSDIDLLLAQGVYGPIAAQTISGLFKAQHLSSEAGLAANMHSQIMIRLVDSTGTQKAVLYSGDTSTGTTDPANEFIVAFTNRHYPRVSIPRLLTSAVAADGDYLVVEVGAREHNTATTGLSASNRIGQATTDLLENDTDTANNSPWVEFLSGIAPYVPDVTAPVPGASGTITTASVSGNTLTLNWTKGTDAVSAQSALQYEIRQSTSNNISNIASAEANGTIINAYTADIATFGVSGLSPTTTYYFNVIVKDLAGNKAIYTTKSETTTTAITYPDPGTLTCTIRTSACSGGEVEIYEMENTTNSHAGLASASYSNLVCCTGVTGLGNACSGIYATVLKLSDDTNAHVRQGTLSDYSGANNACISVATGGRVEVGYQETNCTGWDTSLGAMIGTTNSHVGSSSWTAGTTKICATADVGGTLTADIVDAGGAPVSVPAIVIGALPFSLGFQVSNGTFGTTNEKVRVSNSTANPMWSLTIAAAGGLTSLLSAGTPKYDFNDPTADAVDGGDGDAYGGQMTLNPSIGTLGGTCSSTGVTLGSAVGFSQGVTDSITLLSSGATADTDCYWDFTGIGVAQTIPAEQTAAAYSLNMMVSILAI